MVDVINPTGQILPEAAATGYTGIVPEILGTAVEFSKTPYILGISVLLLYLGIKLVKRGISIQSSKLTR